MDLEPTPRADGLLSGFDARMPESFDGRDVERGDLYAEIAERRAQLECAETLRRVRAL